ncbi:hypothetical protein EH31_13890 [Erythrobacter longus]|uniref:Tll0287-like domain-containing protein n=1 Tax=Erythrobacter longus TaxID=1044 RepID=A0A074MU57_ERYLO|nr:DUF3365 domain-containing protein [Erythrobacter longus]KEO89122.1 hypothetical protein EH31_13890 [Erythrobacter longus]
MQFNQCKHALALIAASSALGLGGCSQDTSTEESDTEQAAFLNQSQKVTAQFQSELQTTLSTAIGEAGAVGAIGVCQSAAPAIAQRLSEESGLAVSRIARRNRNANGGLPLGLEPLYAKLEAAPLDNGAPRNVHGTVDGAMVYLQAIPMKEQPCSACHGTNIDPVIINAIAKAYPGDLATGFEPGELRGAFLVSKQEAP